MSPSSCARFLTAALTLAAYAFPAVAADKKPKLDHALQHALKTGIGSVDVIIRVVPGGHDVVRSTLVGKGRTITGEHPSINALSATVDAGDLAELVTDPLV